MRPSPARLLNILVPVKRWEYPPTSCPCTGPSYLADRCVDYAVKIRLNAQRTAVDTNVKHSMVNLFTLSPSIVLKSKLFRTPSMKLVCSFTSCVEWVMVHRVAAVEEAVRIRKRLKDQVKSIKLVTIGPAKSVETLRTGLAMGADEGIHVELPDSAPPPEPLGIAKALKAIIERDMSGIDLVIMGKQAIDDDAGQTGQILAGLLNWSQATFASQIEFNESSKEAIVTREVDGGHEILKCRLPLIVTTDLRFVVWYLGCSTVSSDMPSGLIAFRLNGM